MENETLKTLPQRGSPKTMRTIALEEHFATPAFIEGPGRQLKEQAQTKQTSKAGPRQHDMQKSSKVCVISANSGSQKWMLPVLICRSCR